MKDFLIKITTEPDHPFNQIWKPILGTTVYKFVKQVEQNALLAAKNAIDDTIYPTETWTKLSNPHQKLCVNVAVHVNDLWWNSLPGIFHSNSPHNFIKSRNPVIHFTLSKIGRFLSDIDMDTIIQETKEAMTMVDSYEYDDSDSIGNIEASHYIFELEHYVLRSFLVGVVRQLQLLLLNHMYFTGVSKDSTKHVAEVS